MSIAWYLALSAIVFSLGAVGVMVRRNPLVVLLCLELMLNGGNLALIAFSRMWGNGDGQILALVVMTVAACEVCIGLGDDRGPVPPPAADRRGRAARAAGLGLERDDLRLAGARLPARGHARDRALGFRRIGSAAGWVGDCRDPALVRGRDRDADLAAGPRSRAPAAGLVAVELRLHRRRGRRNVDPGGPAVGVHDPDRHRGVLDDPPVLGRLHGSRPRLRALLLLPQLLRLLDVAAGARRQLRAADRRLGIRRRRLLPADLLLVPADDRHRGRHQGVRDQRRRRRRAGAGDVLHLQAHPHARLPGDLPRGRTRRLRLQPEQRRPRRRVRAAARRRVREVGPDPAAHLAPRRDGGPDAGLRADPRGHDGHRRRLPDRAHAPAVRTRPGGPGRGRRRSAARRW